ncbi:T-cell immunomodulatory protein [Anguilla rostrata]|uniref:T-cell immunomodulatory protein n=1 Tax=Anguilla rostrata TaxID=7938 RepID=UPI0030D44A31
MRMCKESVLSYTFLILSFGGNYILALQDVTADLFGSESYGTVAAFGDFNSDKQTDIFIIRQQSELVIFLADLKAPYFKPKVHIQKDQLPKDFIISSVVPGDYDGDSKMDVLLTAHPKGSSDFETTVLVFWGNNQTNDTGGSIQLNMTFIDEPLVMDFNGDMIPDIFGVVKGVTQVCYLKDRKMAWHSALGVLMKMHIPHSNAFIDLNQDFTADLFLTMSDSEPPALAPVIFQTWINKDGNFTKTSALKTLDSFKIVGQSAFIDFDGDGKQDQLLPVCMDTACQRSAIYLSKAGESEWFPVLTEFQKKDTVWGFVPPTAGELHAPITLHLGDYNLDGFPDALAILRNVSGSGQRAFRWRRELQHSAAGGDSERDCRGARAWWPLLDIYELLSLQGILDMIVLTKGVPNGELAIHALKNNFEADAYFVKVIVLSGLCSNDCPEKAKPFGVNQPGPYVMYTTVDSNGNLKNASAGQLCQSAHLSLQLPYTVLGLGRSANFLDHLYVGIPRPPGDKDIRKQEWTAIIPNSQLIVIPYPHNDPRSWSAKLYLTPSNIVLLTAIALIGVCVFILVIIGILHWKEKKADDREKRQEAHRFHFDAM